jgi:hypothetical protein
MVPPQEHAFSNALERRPGSWRRTPMTEILDIVCKGTVIVGPAYETLDVVCKGTVVIGPRQSAAIRSEVVL